MEQTGRKKRVGRGMTLAIALLASAVLGAAALLVNELRDPWAQPCDSLRCNMSCLLVEGKMPSHKCIYGECSCSH